MIEYIILVLLSLLPFWWFRNGYILLGHDAGFRFDYLSQLSNLWYSWDPKINFGVDWSLFKGFLITQLPEVIASWATHSFALGEKIALTGWFFVMGAGMLYFLRTLFPDSKYRFFRIFTSIFYMVNYFILDGWTIGERAKFSLYAALPLGLLCIYNVLVKNKPMLRTAIVFGLVYFVLNGGGVLPLYGATFVVLGLGFVFFGWGKPFVRVLSTAGLFALTTLLFNAYYIIPNIYLLRASYSSSVGAQGGIDGLITWERVISAHASALNLLRLQGMPSIYNNPWQPFTKILLTNPVFIVASFVPIALILLGLFFLKHKPKIITFFFVLLPIGLLFSMGTHPPTGVFFELAMRRIPGFDLFRSSFYKFAPALWLPMIVLTGYFLSECIVQRIKNVRLRFTVGCLCVIGILIYHYPFFTTQAFNLSNGYSTRVKVPSYLSNITEQMKRNVEDSDAVLVMPKMADFSPDLPADMYTWHYFSLDIFPRNAVNRRFIANDSHDPIIDRLYAALYEGNKEVFFRLAGLSRINYVLWRSDAVSSQLDSSEAKNFLDTDPHITRVYKSGMWELYKIVNPMYEEAITAKDSFIGYTGSDAGAAYLAESQGTVVAGGDDVVEAACQMCAPNEYARLVSSITLPHTRIKPGSPLFFIEKWQEDSLIRRVQNNPKERIDADIALAQKYLSWGRGDTYHTFMQDAIRQWSILIGQDALTYAVRLKAYLMANKQSVPSILDARVWISEPGVYRYTASVSPGYSIVTSDKNALVTEHSSGGLLFIEARTDDITPPYIFMQRVAKQHIEQTSLSFIKIDPTKYSVHVRATSPYLLIFRDHYDPRWLVSIPGKHVIVDGFANGWIINKSGNYTFTISYDPQQYFYVGVWISSLAILIAVWYGIRQYV